MKRVTLIVMTMLGMVAIAATNEIVRCHSVTLSGNRCKRRAANGEMYCHQHCANASSMRTFETCQAIVTNDVKCTAKTVDGKRYCAQHLFEKPELFR